MEHIVASASPSGRCVVWDLRKNQPVITVSDTSSRVSCGDGMSVSVVGQLGVGE